MAFSKANLSLVSYSGNGFHIWHYTTTDAKATIDSGDVSYTHLTLPTI